MKRCRSGTENYGVTEELRLGVQLPLSLAAFSRPRSPDKTDVESRWRKIKNSRNMTTDGAGVFGEDR